MDLIDRLKELSNRIERQRETVATEEATKTAFILPFLQALGYDVFNPDEVVPELTADHGVKKGEKVDYAIKLDGQIMMLMECKALDSELESKYAGQLFRYFAVTDARFGILTDGARYLFFSDLERPNRMDDRSFFEFNLLDFNESRVAELKQFAKSSFDLETIVGTASNLKYTRALKAELTKEFDTPSDEFVRLLASRVYSGRLTQSVKEEFAGLTEAACREFIRAKVNDRIKSAFERESIEAAPENASIEKKAESIIEENDGIVTTDDEWSAFRIIQAIGAQVADPELINIRDAKSYCAILYDDNNRRPICRLHFGAKKNAVTIFAPEDEQRVDLSKITDLYQHANAINRAIDQYVN